MPVEVLLTFGCCVCVRTVVSAISYSRDLPNPGIKPASLVSPALADRFFTIVPPGNGLMFLSSQNPYVEILIPKVMVEEETER